MHDEINKWYSFVTKLHMSVHHDMSHRLDSSCYSLGYALGITQLHTCHSIEAPPYVKYTYPILHTPLTNKLQSMDFWNVISKIRK
jgi:hypothetical protein